MALQAADPSCRTTSTSPPIYVDCSNGTVTDNRTGLVWLKDANCFGVFGSQGVRHFVDSLADLSGTTADGVDCGLSDGSAPGDWRLPSIAEWEAMVADAVGCMPMITSDSGGACWDDGPSSFDDVKATSCYWSSTRLADSPESVYNISLTGGTVTSTDSSLHFCHVWPVRGGQ